MMRCQLSSLLLAVWLLLCLLPRQEGAYIQLCGEMLRKHGYDLCGASLAKLYERDRLRPGKVEKAKREAEPFADVVPASSSENAAFLKMMLEAAMMQSPLREPQDALKVSALKPEDTQAILSQLESSGIEKHARRKRKALTFPEQCCKIGCYEYQLQFYTCHLNGFKTDKKKKSS